MKTYVVSIILIFMIILELSSDSKSFSVACDYSSDNPFIIAPGESKYYDFRLRISPLYDEEMYIRQTFSGECLSLPGNVDYIDYWVSYGEVVHAPIFVSIPLNMTPGNYLGGVKWTELSVSNNGTIDFVQSMSMQVPFTVTPEPASLLFLTLGGLTVLRRRK